MRKGKKEKDVIDLDNLSDDDEVEIVTIGVD